MRHTLFCSKIHSDSSKQANSTLSFSPTRSRNYVGLIAVHLAGASIFIYTSRNYVGLIAALNYPVTQFMSPLRKPLILRTVSSSAFTLLEIRTYIEQNVNANSRINGRVIRKSDKMKGVFGIGTFRSGLIIFDIKLKLS